MDKADLPFLSASELSALIRKKEVSPVEVTETYLKRIDELDFKFNSFLLVLREQALQQAREAEQAIAQGNYLGPMHGIPVGVKDQLWTKGIRSTGGSRFLIDFIPDEDATVVTNLKKAGAILLGKTNLTEFAITGFTHRYRYPRNPWNLDMSPGGSSSGSGAATRAFLCATSIGEDTGGSIRRPAAWGGLVGVRPTWGRVSRYGVMTGVWSMDAVGPISRTVEDAAITLGAIAGYDSKDPYTWQTPVPDYTKALDGNIRGLRIGIITELLNNPQTDPEVRDAVVKASTVLGELGATVEEVSLPLTAQANVIGGASLTVEPAMNQRDWVKNRIHDYGHDNRIGLLVGSIMPAQAYYKADKLRTLLRRQVHEALEKYTVLISPTSGKTAVRQDGFDPPVTGKRMTSRLPFMLTNTFNLASCPALSVPCGFSSDKLPVGLQIGGKPFDEETILKVAHAYEQATPWHKMRPPNV